MKGKAGVLGVSLLLAAVPLQAQRGGHSAGGFGGRITVRGSFNGKAGPPVIRGAAGPVRFLHMPRRTTGPAVVQRGGGQSFTQHILLTPGSFNRATSSNRVFLGSSSFQRQPVLHGLGFTVRHHHVFPHHVFRIGFGFPRFCFFNGLRFNSLAHACFFDPLGSPFISTSFCPFFPPFFHRGFSPFFFPFASGVGSTFTVVPDGVVRADAAALRESEPAPAPRPLTVLVFKDGSQYGVIDYWLEGGRLHYITSYGGENAVPLDQIDLEKTVQLNWVSGIEFVLRPKPAAR